MMLIFGYSANFSFLETQGLHIICTIDTVSISGILSQNNKKNVLVKPLACLKILCQSIIEYQFSWFSGTIYFKSPECHMEIIGSC